jgi:hypothetical protein
VIGLLVTDFFDTMGTMVAVAYEAGPDSGLFLRGPIEALIG